VSHQELTLDPMQQRQQARFRHMGLSARAMPGGRSLLVSLTLARHRSNPSPGRRSHEAYSREPPGCDKPIRSRSIRGDESRPRSTSEGALGRQATDRRCRAARRAEAPRLPHADSSKRSRSPDPTRRNDSRPGPFTIRTRPKRRGESRRGDASLARDRADPRRPARRKPSRKSPHGRSDRRRGRLHGESRRSRAFRRPLATRHRGTRGSGALRAIRRGWTRTPSTTRSGEPDRVELRPIRH